VQNRERWEHWINKFMQKKILGTFMSVVPIDSPRLDLRLYTKIFEHLLLDSKDYTSFKRALLIFPEYLINHDHLLALVQKTLGEQDEE
jgi:hypothetical protein